MQFVFEFEVGEAEQIRACRVVTYRRPETRRLLIVTGVFAVAVTLVHASGILADFHEMWLGTIGAWGAFIGAAAGTHGSIRSIARNLRQNSRAASAPLRYDLADSGFGARGLGVETALQWENVIEVYETPEFFLFYVSVGFAHLLPSRVVPSDQLAKFREAVRSWVGTRARLQSDRDSRRTTG